MKKFRETILDELNIFSHTVSLFQVQGEGGKEFWGFSLFADSSEHFYIYDL
jgi:hypothetical protein